MTKKAPPSPNGISWMLTDTWTRAQAALRMRQQTINTVHHTPIQIHEDDKSDEIQDNWERKHRPTTIKGVLPPETAIPKAKPVPSYQNLVQEQEHPA